MLLRYFRNYMYFCRVCTGRSRKYPMLSCRLFLAQLPFNLVDLIWYLGQCQGQHFVLADSSQRQRQSTHFRDFRSHSARQGPTRNRAVRPVILYQKQTNPLSRLSWQRLGVLRYGFRVHRVIGCARQRHSDPCRDYKAELV